MSPRPGPAPYSGPERRTSTDARHLARALEQDVLTAHLVLTSALVGRTSPDHVARAFRRAGSTARRILWGEACPVCQRVLAPRRWVLFKGFAYEVNADHVLARVRAYCREHCAVAALLREGFDFLGSSAPRHALHEVDAVDPDITLEPLP